MTRRKSRGPDKTHPLRSTRWIPRRKPTDGGSPDDAGYDPRNHPAQETPQENGAEKNAAQSLEEIDEEIDNSIAHAEEIHRQARQRKRSSEASYGDTA